MFSNRTYLKGLMVAAIVAAVCLFVPAKAQAQYPFARPFVAGYPQVQVRPGGYLPAFGTFGRVGVNPVTGSRYIPGAAVIKPTGLYRPVAPGVYANPWTGNTYVPSSGLYLRRW
jgi:hypothetical protein